MLPYVGESHPLIVCRCGSMHMTANATGQLICSDCGRRVDFTKIRVSPGGPCEIKSIYERNAGDD